MSFFKRQPEYLDRQSSAAKAKSELLEKFRCPVDGLVPFRSLFDFLFNGSEHAYSLPKVRIRFLTRR